MRDLQRKVNKFIKERASVNAKKSRGNSPALNKSLNKSLNPNSVTYGFNSTSQSFTKITPNALNRKFSMTVSFNPRFDLPKSRDIAIYHQDRQQKNVMVNSVDYTKSPKRDPILQNNQEASVEFKAPFKPTPFTNKMTIFDDEPIIKKKGNGECKGEDHRSLSPKGPCIRTFVGAALRQDQSPENPRRVRKGVANSVKNLFNPITEGDLEYLKQRRARKAGLGPKPTEETEKLNKRKQLLPTEIGFAPKGRIFRESSLVMSAHPIEDPVPVKGRRYLSPQERRQPEMQGLLEYSFSGKFRDENVSPKCTSKSFYDVIKSMGSKQE